ncbi:hypothetical protein WEH80_34755 [Actinomycetes bacterium KLBMP 9759]
MAVTMLEITKVIATQRWTCRIHVLLLMGTSEELVQVTLGVAAGPVLLDS